MIIFTYNTGDKSFLNIFSLPRHSPDVRYKTCYFRDFGDFNFQRGLYFIHFVLCLQLDYAELHSLFLATILCNRTSESRLDVYRQTLIYFDNIEFMMMDSIWSFWFFVFFLISFIYPFCKKLFIPFNLCMHYRHLVKSWLFWI